MSSVILIADDDPDDRELLKEVLHANVFSLHCIETANGQEALDWLEGHVDAPPSLIFLDLNMPRIGGRDFLQRFRKKRNI